MIGEKLKQLINRKGREELSEVCDEIGITVTALYNVFKLDRVPSQKVLDYVHKTYPNLNFNWWFYDVGPKWMDKPEETEVKQGETETVPIKEPPSFSNLFYTDPELVELLEEERRLKEEMKELLKKKVSDMRNQIFTFKSEMQTPVQTMSNDSLGKLKGFTNETVLQQLGLFTQHLGIA